MPATTISQLMTSASGEGGSAATYRAVLVTYEKIVFDLGAPASTGI
jgi:hypothetical protein